MNPRRQLKRSNLFVLRIWSQETDNHEGAIKWEGQVRRAVDGEAHHFDDLQGLLDWLIDNLEGNSTVGLDRIGSELSGEHQENERRLR